MLMKTPPTQIRTATSSSQASEPSTTELRILHIEDSTDDQVLLQAAFRRAKLPINWSVAETAACALSYLESLANGRTTPVALPDLIVLDIVMPGECGFTVLKYIRRNRRLRSLPVVILGGALTPAICKEATALGADLILEKPMTFRSHVQMASDLYSRFSRK